ncbi:MAG: choice-of-anchor U domain-containing protein [Haliea sp.]|uniref:choice-of-anchor U domain-containing protein n=1 Tax=Haliea sp. TaxID=1932666 RepID=UPI0032EBA0D0
MATALGFLTSLTAGAAIINDDVLVQGPACVGFDCPTADALALPDDLFSLRENNLRILFFQDSAPQELGKVWNLRANSTSNYGASYFRLELKSLTKDNVLISDGTEPRYDCSEPFDLGFPDQQPPLDGVHPPGEVVLIPGLNPDSTGPGDLYACLPREDYTRRALLTMEPEGAVTLGYGSVREAGHVSVGDTGAERQIKHVADGQAATDLLTVGQVNDLSTLADKQAELDALRSQLAALTAVMESLEQADQDGDGVANIDDPFPNARESLPADGIVIGIVPDTAASSCTLATGSAVAAASLPAPPEGVLAYATAASFSLSGCDIGETVTVTIDLGEAPPRNAVAYKIGESWVPLTGATITGSILSYRLQDGGPFDADGVADGNISDPVGIAFPPPGIPTMSSLALACLTLLMSLIAFAKVRGRRPV